MPEYRFCPRCNAPADELYGACPTCGQDLDPEERPPAWRVRLLAGLQWLSLQRRNRARLA